MTRTERMRFRKRVFDENPYRHCVNYLQLALQDLTSYMGMSAPGYAMAGSDDYDPLEF